MLKSPGLYSVGVDYLSDDDPTLIQKRADIIHSAAVLLEKCNLIKYERSTGKFTSTELGRIASYFYVTYNSMATYNQHLRPTMTTLELFRVFALSNEFKLIPVSKYIIFVMLRRANAVAPQVRQDVRHFPIGPKRYADIMSIDRKSWS